MKPASQKPDLRARFFTVRSHSRPQACFALALLALVFFAPHGAAQSRSTNPSQQILEQVQADILAQRWEQAQAKLEAAAPRLTGNPDFYFLRGAVLLNHNLIREALEELNRAVTLAPRRARFYLLRGQAYQQAGDLSAAKRDYRKSAELEPRNPAGVLALVQVHVQEQRPGEAIPILDQALQRVPNSAALHYERGRIHDMLGQASKAVAGYSRAVALNPRLALPHAGLGRLYRQKPETLARSVKHLRQAVALEQQNWRWQHELGLTFLQQRDPAAARAALEKAAELNPGEPQVQSALAQAYRQLEMPEEARAARERFAEQARSAEQKKLGLARLESEFKRAQELEFAGQLEEAVALYEQILGSAPDEPQVYLALARLHLNARHPERAEEHIRRALQSQPNSPDYHELLALALMDQRRLDEAEAELQAVIVLKPSDGAPHNLLGNLLLRKDEVDAAIAAYQRAIDLGPREPDYRLNLSGAYRRKGDFAAAQREMEIYQKLTQTKPAQRP